MLFTRREEIESLRKNRGLSNKEIMNILTDILTVDVNNICIVDSLKAVYQSNYKLFSNIYECNNLDGMLITTICNEWNINNIDVSPLLVNNLFTILSKEYISLWIEASKEDKLLMEECTRSNNAMLAYRLYYKFKKLELNMIEYLKHYPNISQLNLIYNCAIKRITIPLFAKKRFTEPQLRAILRYYVNGCDMILNPDFDCDCMRAICLAIESNCIPLSDLRAAIEEYKYDGVIIANYVKYKNVLHNLDSIKNKEDVILKSIDITMIDIIYRSNTVKEMIDSFDKYYIKERSYTANKMMKEYDMNINKIKKRYPYLKKTIAKLLELRVPLEQYCKEVAKIKNAERVKARIQKKKDKIADKEQKIKEIIIDFIKYANNSTKIVTVETYCSRVNIGKTTFNNALDLVKKTDKALFDKYTKILHKQEDMIDDEQVIAEAHRICNKLKEQELGGSQFLLLDYYIITKVDILVMDKVIKKYCSKFERSLFYVNILKKYQDIQTVSEKWCRDEHTYIGGKEVTVAIVNKILKFLEGNSIPLYIVTYKEAVRRYMKGTLVIK